MAWRLEEEYSYRENASKALPLDPILGITTSGTRTSNAILTNLLYDFRAKVLHLPRSQRATKVFGLSPANCRMR